MGRQNLETRNKLKGPPMSIIAYIEWLLASLQDILAYIIATLGLG